jgi:hypothetical protein
MSSIEVTRHYTLKTRGADIFEHPEFFPKRVLNLKTGVSYNVGKAIRAGA